MSDIPTKVYREILRRVPAYELFQFRSVCKSWCRIIDDPGFAKLHIDRGMDDNTLLLRNDTGKLFLLPLHLLDDLCIYCLGSGCTGCSTEDGLDVKVYNAVDLRTPIGPCVPNLPAPSCNGLILISTFKKNCAWLIWNPFTGESIEVPPLRGETSYFGFGYDEAKNDYKVVKVVESEMFIYSVNSGVWRKFKAYHKVGKIKVKIGAFAKGALHWVAYPEEGDLKSKHGYIVSLDLTKGTYNRIELPGEINETCEKLPVGDASYSLELVASNGCLYLIFAGEMVSSVWEIHKRNAGRKILSLNQSNISLMAYFENEDRALFRYKNEKFLSYEPEDDRLQKISMKINTCAYNRENCEYLYDTFTCQILPMNIARLKISCDDANEGGASRGTLSKKRKRGDANQRLSLKFTFGEAYSQYDD